MAPKKASPAAKSAASAVSPKEPDYVNPNVEWHQKVTDAVDTILGQFGMDFVDKQPLTLEEGALVAPMDWQVMHDRLMNPQGSHNEVLCAGGVNVLRCNPLQSMTPSVRINVQKVEAMMMNLWGHGKIVPLLEPVDFVAKQLVNGKMPEFDRISPEEPVQALLVWVARRIRDDADEPELELWRKILLSTQARCVRASSWDERYFWSVNSRRRTADIAKTVTHLASQICQDIWLFKRRKESLLNKTLTNAEVAGLYLQFMPDTETDEEPRSDEGNIQRACQVYERVLSNKVIASVIAWSDTTHGSEGPFNSIGKLVEISAKLKKIPTLEYFFTSMKLALQQDQLEVGELSTKKLRGGGGHGGKIGLLDVVITKKAMRDFLLSRWLDVQNNISPEHKALLKKTFDTAENYEANYIATRRV
ncbi:unnamed protein product [Effrenium voratum]|uniref:Uncharacterized protein n=1 Tax=Effrenium voratum TaxID=2562239 RepID=A0AA36JKG6_9DINO|nr:unnamed protein product [Effrenium voratum]CAJ1418006.1 unnamed protein product [Effrenium voratum]